MTDALSNKIKEKVETGEQLEFLDIMDKLNSIDGVPKSYIIDLNNEKFNTDELLKTKDSELSKLQKQIEENNLEIQSLKEENREVLRNSFQSRKFENTSTTKQEKTNHLGSFTLDDFKRK